MKRGRSGFTLIEVLVSMLVFFILAGGIFGAIKAATTASTEITLSQLAASRMDAFQRFGRNVFVNLPAGATIDLRIKQWAGKGDVVQLLIAPSPEVAHFGGRTARADGVAIGAIPDGSGAYRISMASYDPELPPDAIDGELQEARWIPLLPDVTTLRWRFLQGVGAQLEETWDAGRGRPALVNLEVTRNKTERSEMQFWIPPLLNPSEGGGDDDGEGGPDADPQEAPGPGAEGGGQ